MESINHREGANLSELFVLGRTRSDIVDFGSNVFISSVLSRSYRCLVLNWEGVLFVVVYLNSTDPSTDLMD